MTRIRIVTLALTSLMLLGSGTIATPSYATDQGEAVKLCSKNPSCNTYFGAGGTVSIWGKNSQGNYEITCPAQGACVCVACPNPQRTVGSPGKGDVFNGTMGGRKQDSMVEDGSQPTALTGSIVETILKWKLKLPKGKKVVEEAMESLASDHDGDGGGASDAGGSTGHIGSGNSGDFGQWHASGNGGTSDVFQ